MIRAAIFDCFGVLALSVGQRVDDQIKNVPLLEYIRQLKSQNFKIGLISNISNDWITSSLLTLEEQKLFDDMVLSYQVNLAKPDPRIFELACHRLGVLPKETIFVDDLVSYCAAAEEVGLKSIIYNDLTQLKSKILLLTYGTNGG